ncbi:MAG TPA: hypothetical protein PLZ51_13080, partial [Aggregatilineales bacterium]|nr:hypothetical protein [Aggregatilineales bacterium]
MVKGWSEVRQFTIEQFDTPILVSLPDNQIYYSYLRLSTNNLHFEWLPVTDGKLYEFEIATDSTFDNILVTFSSNVPFLDTATKSYLDPLTYGVYYWRI